MPRLTNSTDKAPSRRKRQIESEVHGQHGGDYRAYLEHAFKTEIHSTPHRKRDDLHSRWFSSTLRDWFEVQQEIDIGYGGLRRSVTVSSWELTHTDWKLISEKGQISLVSIRRRGAMQCWGDPSCSEIGSIRRSWHQSWSIWWTLYYCK